METEWDYSGRKGRDGQKKKIGKANERKGKLGWLIISLLLAYAYHSTKTVTRGQCV